MSNCIHGLNRALVECEQCRSVERAKEFNTTKAAIEQAAIQSFARLLTEGDREVGEKQVGFGPACVHCVFRPQKEFGEGVCGNEGDASCPIRQAANLPLLKEVSNGQT